MHLAPSAPSLDPTKCTYKLSHRTHQNNQWIDISAIAMQSLETSAMQAIAIARRLIFMSRSPSDDCEGSGITHGSETKNHKDDVRDALPGSGSDGTIVHERLEQ